MSPLDLIRTSLAGLPRPRPAAGPLAVHYCARVARRTLRDYTLDPRVLADCVLAYYERFKPDAVWLSADTWVNAHAMGAAVAFPQGRDDLPLDGTGEPAVRTPADIDRIPDPDPNSQGRWPLMLQAMRLIRAGIGNRAAVIACFDEYPFTIACALMGIQTAMMKIIDDLPMVSALMERGAQYVAAYALALADAGADMLSGGDAPAGLIGPELYREVAQPYEKRVIDTIKSNSALPVSLHICGSATPILKDMAATGADVLEIDQKVDLATACRAVGPGVAIWGNLDPVNLLERGTPADIRRAVARSVQTFRDCAHTRYVISSGCTLTMDTPPENLDALFEAVRESSL